MPLTISEFTNFAKNYVRNLGQTHIFLSKISESLENEPVADVVAIVKSIRGGTWGGTVLHYAAINGHTELIATILKDMSKEEKFEVLSLGNTNSTNVLQEAAGNSKVKTLKFLLESVDYVMAVQLIEHTTSHGYTTIHRASFTATGIYDANILEMLLNFAPDAKAMLFKQTSTGFTALHESLFYQEVAAVRLILSRLPTIQEKERIMTIRAKSGNTVLHTAARSGNNPEPIDMLLDPLPTTLRKQLLSTVNDKGHTPKALATQYSHDSVVKVLQYYEDHDVPSNMGLSIISSTAKDLNEYCQVLIQIRCCSG